MPALDQSENVCSQYVDQQQWHSQCVGDCYMHYWILPRNPCPLLPMPPSPSLCMSLLHLPPAPRVFGVRLAHSAPCLPLLVTCQCGTLTDLVPDRPWVMTVISIYDLFGFSRILSCQVCLNVCVCVCVFAGKLLSNQSIWGGDHGVCVVTLLNWRIASKQCVLHSCMLV